MFDSLKFIPKKIIFIFLIVSGLFLYFGQSDKGSSTGFVNGDQALEAWKENPGKCAYRSERRIFRIGHDCTLSQYVREQNAGALMVYGAIISTLGYLIWDKLKKFMKLKAKNPKPDQD